jgi:hypothetical protein
VSSNNALLPLLLLGLGAGAVVALASSQSKAKEAARKDEDEEGWEIPPFEPGTLPEIPPELAPVDLEPDPEFPEELYDQFLGALQAPHLATPEELLDLADALEAEGAPYYADVVENIVASVYGLGPNAAEGQSQPAESTQPQVSVPQVMAPAQPGAVQMPADFTVPPGAQGSFQGQLPAPGSLIPPKVQGVRMPGVRGYS